jgi:hypothetical protein
LSKAGVRLALVVYLIASARGGHLLSQSALPVGEELQVNSYTISAQRRPAVAMDGDGDFVVAWQSYLQDGSFNGVFARRFSSAGTPLGSEFQVNSYTGGNEYRPDVAMDDDGDFVVVWTWQDAPLNFEVFGRCFDSAGAALGPEFQVNSYTVNYQRIAAVGMDADGDFVVAWESRYQDGSGIGDLGVFAQRFDAAGVAQGAEFQVNSFTSLAPQRYATVAMGDQGAFIIAWQSYGQDGSGYGVFARGFDAAGVGEASEFQVNAYTEGRQDQAAVGMGGDGRFVVAWRSLQEASSYGYGIFARAFDAAGVGQGGEFHVNTYTVNNQTRPQVGVDDVGNFIVTWQSSEQDAHSFGIFAQHFDAAGAAQGGEFQVNSYTTADQFYSAIAMKDDGDFVVAWESFQDGDSFGVFVQRGAPRAPVDIDGDASTSPLTDGLLLLRFLFGFGGTTLISGAVDPDCTSCDAAAIESNLMALEMLADIDGNGDVDALTDGLLVLRFLFGFTGATLTNGAVGQGCTRCEAAAIQTYLQSLF